MDAVESTRRVVGRYVLFDKIASGGMATVRLGRLVGQAGFSRTVAVKCLYPQFASDPEFVSMFLDEARLVSRIRSPYVVPTLDVVTLESELFIVMEYVPGESLARLMRPESPAAAHIPVDVAVTLMCNVLEGLHAAHEATSEDGKPLGIVHRDVSPQNIIMGTDGLGHLIDFGVAKAAGRLQTTRDGQVKGKLAYMPPEQLRGETLTQRADIYSASVVLWEALAGQRLFHAADEGSTVTRVLMGAVERPSEAARRRDAKEREAIESLDAVVLRGLARDASKRFETAREMASALERCVPRLGATAVGEWLESVAGSSLKERTLRIAAIESGSKHLAPEKPAVDVEVPQATQASSISAVSDVREAAQSRRRTGIVATIVAVGSLIVVGGYLVVRGVFSHPTPLAPQDPMVTSASSASPIEIASSIVAPDPEPAAPASADTMVVEAGATASPTVRRSIPSRKKSVSNCDPPYTFDSRGKKRYKSNCL